MSFVSTYSAGSIRGWQATGPTNIYVQTQILTPNTSYASQKYFGNSVAISNDGNYIIVGESDFSGITGTPGKAYIYNKDTITDDFVLQQEITPNSYSGNAWWFFGSIVSIDYLGSRVAVGAPGYNTNSNPPGSLYIFDRSGNTWTQQANILTSDANSTSFSKSLAMSYSGNVVIAGATDNQSNVNSGAVYVYTYNGSTWTKSQKLKANITLNNQEFGSYPGRSICISQDNDANYIAIAAVGEDSDKGAVYIFNKSGNSYTQQAKISNPSTVAGKNFGRDVTLNNDGNILTIANPAEGINAPGVVYQYERIGNAWSLQQTISSSQTNNNDAFGSGISSNDSSNVVFISDGNYPITSNVPNSQGAIFVNQQFSSYIETQILQSNPVSNNDFFGTSTSTNGLGNILVGSSPTANTNEGRVFIFKS
jgi:hypothetical protein